MTERSTQRNWRDRIDLLEALLGLPGRVLGRNEDVTKLARFGTLVGLSGGFFAVAEGCGFVAFCAPIFAGSLLGGQWPFGAGEWGRHLLGLKSLIGGLKSPGCIIGSLMAFLSVVASVLEPNVRDCLLYILFQLRHRSLFPSPTGARSILEILKIMIYDNDDGRSSASGTLVAACNADQQMSLFKIW